jgi:hypothetical protein
MFQRPNGLRIDALSSDYLSVTRNVYKWNEKIESPAVLKKNGYYFMFGSHLTGWNANDNVSRGTRTKWFSRLTQSFRSTAMHNLCPGLGPHGEPLPTPAQTRTIARLRSSCHSDKGPSTSEIAGSRRTSCAARTSGSRWKSPEPRPV